METRILTIMFTDLKGFTERTSTQSREEINYLLDTQETLVCPIIEKYRGTIVKTIGDAFMVTFESPTNAVHCGLEIQDVLREYNMNEESEQQLHMRMGINSGEVNIKNGDVFGEPVNIASRIESIAEPGEVYFTDSVYLAMNKNEIPSAEVGKRHLKGIAEMVTVYKVLRDKGALDQHLAKRKAAVKLTGKLDKSGEIKSAFAWGRRKLFRAFLWFIGVLFVLSILGNISAKKKAQEAQSQSPEALRATLQKLTPEQRTQVKQRLIESERVQINRRPPAPQQ